MSALSGRKPRAWWVVALLALLVAPGSALACSCSWGGPFTKVALGTDLVVLVEVRSYYRHSMDVRILEVLKGSEARRVVRVWGDDGALCRPYVSSFARGTRWILALKHLGEPAAQDYVMSICGDFWLEVRGDLAVGRIIVPQHGRSLETVSLADMLAWIRSGGAGRIAPTGPSP